MAAKKKTASKTTTATKKTTTKRTAKSKTEAKAAAQTADAEATAGTKKAPAKKRKPKAADAKPAAKSARGKAANGKANGKATTKKASKATKRKVSPVPRGYKTVTPSVSLADANATIAFCKKAFGAKVKSKMPAPGGKIMQAEIEIGDSIIMVADAMQEPACISSLFLYVPDVDKAMAKAVKAGATVTMPAQDMFWGDRFGRLVDPQGNIWSIGSRIEIVRPEELKKRAKAAAKQMSLAAAS